MARAKYKNAGEIDLLPYLLQGPERLTQKDFRLIETWLAENDPGRLPGWRRDREAARRAPHEDKKYYESTEDFLLRIGAADLLTAEERAKLEKQPPFALFWGLRPEPDVVDSFHSMCEQRAAWHQQEDRAELAAAWAGRLEESSRKQVLYIEKENHQ